MMAAPPRRRRCGRAESTRVSCGHGSFATASLDTGNDLPYAWFKADFEFQEKYFRDGNQYPIGVYTSTADYFVEGSYDATVLR